MDTLSAQVIILLLRNNLGIEGGGGICIREQKTNKRPMGHIAHLRNQLKINKHI